MARWTPRGSCSSRSTSRPSSGSRTSRCSCSVRASVDRARRGSGNGRCATTFESWYSYSIMTTAAAPKSAPSTISPTQLRLLASPVRQEIVDVLESAGARSVAELGALLGRPADALYHHLRRLVAVGLVEVERRQVGRHAFAVYDLRERPVRISYAQPVRRGDIARV